MRRKLFMLFVLQLIIISCKSTQNTESEIQKNTKGYFLKDLSNRPRYHEYNRLNSEDLDLLKNYLKTAFGKDLDSLNYLTISYLKTLNMCWYDSYSHINDSRSKVFIEKLKTYMNTDLLCAHYDKRGSTFSEIDQKRIIYSLFSKDTEACDFTVTINKVGMYYFNPGHFNHEISNAFKNELNNFYPLN